jgi:IS4 transposase
MQKDNAPLPRRTVRSGATSPSQFQGMSTGHAEFVTYDYTIESSYRLMEQARARTSSPNAALRFLLMGLALFLVNMWLRCHWLYLRVRGAGPRRVARKRFRFDRLLHFLSRAVERLYGTLSTVSLPPP